MHGGWLLVAGAPASAETYTLLDGALAEARQLQASSSSSSSTDDAPLLIGLSGSAALEDWARLSAPQEALSLIPVVASDGPALQRHLLARGVSCGLLVAPLGRRGFTTQHLCAAPMSVWVVLHDGQRLQGHAQPQASAPPHLLLTLPGTTEPLSIPLAVIRSLEPVP